MAKCMICRKSLLKCNCHSRPSKPEKGKVQIKDKNGRTRMVVKNTGNRTDEKGNTWCRCGSRVLDGRCMNITCSTRK